MNFGLRGEWRPTKKITAARKGALFWLHPETLLFACILHDLGERSAWRALRRGNVRAARGMALAQEPGGGTLEIGLQ